MKFTIFKSVQIGSLLSLAVFVIFGVSSVTVVSGQDKRKTASPPPKEKPAKKTAAAGVTGTGNATGAGVGTGTGAGTGTANGSGVGAANGSGIGAQTGTGIGTPSGTAMGTPSGEGIGIRRTTIIGNPSDNAVGAPVVTTDPVTGAVSANPLTPTATTVKTNQKAVAFPRTYIKESDGRCYYVTIAGGKHFVARTNCSLYR